VAGVRRELRQLSAFANVDHQRGAPHVAGILSQLGELRNQFDGQVVDCIVAQVFESLEDCRLPRAAQTGDDHQLRALRIQFPGDAFGH
jgi:hypothetical protein